LNTSWKQASGATTHVLAQKPAITEAIIQLNQRNPFPFPQGQFVCASGVEIICPKVNSNLTKEDQTTTYEQP
jgi:hypothetical protein